MSYLSQGQAAEILRDAVQNILHHLERGKIGLAQSAGLQAIDVTAPFFVARDADLCNAAAMFEQHLPVCAKPLNPISQRDGS